MLSLTNLTNGGGYFYRYLQTTITVVALGTSAFAQKTYTVQGTVTDSKREALIGVSVRVKGTQQGVATDLNGKFILKGLANDATLEFSYVGMLSQTLKLQGQSHVNVILKEDASNLSEVVVTAYGTKIQRSKLTNAISTVKAETFEHGLFSNPSQALSGAVAGLRVIQSSGRLTNVPKIVLRGGTSYEGTGSPLIIIDGQIRSGFNDFNPEDIEDMQVLKDAGSAAIYGARSSNGVILITTKQGKAGRSEIKFSSKIGLNYLNSPHEFLNGADYIRYMRRAYADAKFQTKEGKTIYIAPQELLNAASPFGLGNDVLSNSAQWNVALLSDANKQLLGQGWRQMVDPLDPQRQIIYKEIVPMNYNVKSPSISQDYNISMSGGNDKGTYYAGFGYYHAKGLPVSTFYKRISALFNGSYQVRPWLKSITNFNYNRANWLSMPAMLDDEASYFGRIASVPPTARYEDKEGKPLMGPNLIDGNQSFQLDKFFRDNQNDKFSFGQSLELTPLKGLTVTLRGNWHFQEEMNERFNKDYQSSADGTINRTRLSSAEVSRQVQQTYNALANYQVNLGLHALDAMAGMEYYDFYKRGLSAAGQEAGSDDFRDLAYTSNAEGKRNIDTWHERRRILSYFGRLNYEYDGRYLLSFVSRYDGYSTLLNNRWGFFPGISGGWLMSKENFFKDALPFVSFAKLRASYGLSGNASSIGSYSLQGVFGSSGKYNGRDAFITGTLPNLGLRWEKTATSEIGIDLGFLENRLNLNLAYYHRLTSDKHADLSIPPTTGISNKSVKSNNGQYQSQGIELELNAKIIDTKDWGWRVDANLAYLRNKVLKLPNNGLERNRQGAQEIYTGKKVFDPVSKQMIDERIWVGGYQEGQEPGLLVGYKFLGIYRSPEELPEDLVILSPLRRGYGTKAWQALSAEEQEQAIPIQLGDAKWQDVNGDGKIDYYDNVVIGNTTPRVTGGISTSLRYKQWRLSLRADYALGFWVYDNFTPFSLQNLVGGFSTTSMVHRTWSPQNPSGDLPRYTYEDLSQVENYRISTLFASRGDYISLREINLSYSLPSNWAKKLFCRDISLSATVQNLGYLTAARSLYSPEAGGSIGAGYPLPRTLILGLNMTF